MVRPSARSWRSWMRTPILERCLNMLRPWEHARVYPIAWAVGISLVLGFLVCLILASSSSVLIGYAAIAIVVFLFGGLMSEDLRHHNSRGRRRQHVRDSRGMFRRTHVVDIEPDGEFVRVICRWRNDGLIALKSERFHAVKEAEEAHECVDRWLAWKFGRACTQESRQLARVLAEKT